MLMLIITRSCISSVSYIKPQLFGTELFYRCVVYRPFPTSNHNVSPVILGDVGCISSVSYIKPQLVLVSDYIVIRCISSVSYIKPQPKYTTKDLDFVVYRPFPTSNHNYQLGRLLGQVVVYRPFPTSNHNHRLPRYN